MNYKFIATDEEKHSSAHIVAMAVKRLYPGTKLGIGPVTKEGFYYEFDTPKEITSKDLEAIQNMANQIIKEDLPFRQVFIRREAAENTLLQLGEIYKAELIRAIPDEDISFFRTGDEFIDLCRGPHVLSTGQIGFIHLNGLEKTNWKDDPTRPVLFKVSGMTFKTEADFHDYENNKKYIANRNFVKVGKRLGVIYGESLNHVILTERGTSLHKRIEEFFLKQFSEYSPIRMITQNQSLDSYVEFINKSETLSFRDLPKSYYTCYRTKERIDGKEFIHESLILKSIFDDKHLSQLTISFLDSCVSFLEELSDSIYLDIRTDNVEDPILNAFSTYLQRKIISHNKIISKIGENHRFEIDFIVEDSVKKKFTLMTLIIKKDNRIFYTNFENKKTEVISANLKLNLIQVIAFILEEKELGVTAKLHPEPVVIVPISRVFEGYAKEVQQALKESGINSGINFTSKSLKRKVKTLEKLKTPFILIVGNKEQTNKAISLRHNAREIGLLTTADTVKEIKENI